MLESDARFKDDDYRKHFPRFVYEELRLMGFQFKDVPKPVEIIRRRLKEAEAYHKKNGHLEVFQPVVLREWLELQKKHRREAYKNWTSMDQFWKKKIIEEIQKRLDACSICWDSPRMTEMRFQEDRWLSDFDKLKKSMSSKRE